MKNCRDLIILVALLGINLIAHAEIPNTELRLGNASVSTSENELIVSTGNVEGRWTWTGKGFVTTGFKNLETGREWTTQNPAYLANWDIDIFEGDVKLLSVLADTSTDEGFTSEHIRVIAEIEYNFPEMEHQEPKIDIRYEIWDYPGATGFRTQVFAKGSGEWVAPGIACSDDYRIDYLPLSLEGLTRQTVGFYNNHDSRNDDNVDFVSNNIITTPYPGTEKYNDANILFLYNTDGGVALVKESHKVVNKQGVNTGIFQSNTNGIESLGWGLALANIRRDEYLPCWASWLVCWTGGEDEKQLALKKFDRIRYPIREEDKVLVTNVWGAGQGGEGAKEENIIKEINSSSDLGIEVVQIDAGWQNRDTRDINSEPSVEAYPDGWGKIMKLAKEKNIKMGIWNTAASILAVKNRLIHLNDAGFQYFKIDIGSWSTYDMLSELTTAVREMEIHSNHKAKVNWDVTHKGLRVGYLYNREYGNLFLQNRRLQMAGRRKSSSHAYVPRRILKDQWMFSPYLNLNQIMFNVMTTEYVLPEYSNASLYGDVYSFAITMMSSPLFFTETWKYSPESRKALKEIIRVYKQQRDNLYKGYVFSLGERPDDASWTGFQNVHPSENFGYITLFRGIHNNETEKNITLWFLKDKTLLIEDLLNGETGELAVDKSGNALFGIDQPADFRFYRYKILSSEGSIK